MSSLTIAVSWQATAGEPSKVVAATAELPAVVVLRLAALVEVLDPRDRVEGAGHVQVAVADVVRPRLDHLDQLPLDVPLDHLGLGVRVLLHLDRGVHSHCSVHLVELVHFAVNKYSGKRSQCHRGVNLEKWE